MELTWLGPYRLGKTIGKGGMGSVYEATDTTTGERVAVKALNPQLAQTEGFRERFDAEIESLKTLRHEGIVRLHGYGEQDGILFYSMELVDGTSLEEELKTGRHFNWREVAEITIQLCRALKHAHDHGVVHRDIKPANILVDADDHVKLADFGIARLFGSTQLTTAGGVLGTADYMSPEQADGRPVTERCDQYSLGGVMYALLTGRSPFRANSLPEMLQLQRFAEPEPVRRYARETPAQMEITIQQLLSKDPADRFPNTLVIARHLEAMLKALSRPGKDEFLSGEEVDDTGAAAGDSDNGLSVTRSQVVSSNAVDPSEPLVSDSDVPPDAPTMGVPSDDSIEVDEDLSSLTADHPAEGRVSEKKVGERTRFTTIEDEVRRKRLAEQTTRRGLAVQVAGFTLVLGCILAGFFYLGRPKSDEDLVEQINASAGSSEVEKEIREFLERFPEHARYDEIDKYRRKLDINKLERKLLNQSRNASGSNSRLLPIERHCLAALELARHNPAAAEQMFAAILTLDNSAISGPLEGKQAERRDACLQLAAGRQRELKLVVADLAAREREDLLEKLRLAKVLAVEEPQQAQEIYQAIVILYHDQSWANEIVEKAQAGLQALNP
ncbi:MAG: protein kinase [Pirellulales bacterium]|nr:protein kinase [Pirellulales bacterium]